MGEKGVSGSGRLGWGGRKEEREGTGGSCGCGIGESLGRFVCL